MIIEKKVCDLKPGDILPNVGNRPYVVLGTRATAVGLHTLMVAALGPCPIGHSIEQRISEHLWHPESAVKVEVSDLTPAQQHADELAALLREAFDIGAAGTQRASDGFAIADLRARWRAWEPQVDALLKRIDPPQPPTLEEAIQVLVDVYAKSEDARSVTAISALLDRARSHGLL